MDLLRYKLSSPSKKDGSRYSHSPVPRVRIFPIISLLKSELVDSLSLIGRPAFILATFAFPAEIPSLQVGPLGHPRPWLFRESRSCVVGLLARQSTGWVCLSFLFRVSSWIVIAAHRRKMYLVCGGAAVPWT